MEVEVGDSAAAVQLKAEEATIHSDGMLLYVAQASYEPGASPLSLWIPIQGYTQDKSATVEPLSATASTVDGPLSLFERYVLLHPIRPPASRSYHTD